MLSSRTIPNLWGLGALAACFALVYGGIVADLSHEWLIDENYAHGILVIPIVLYLVWERRAALVSCPASPSVLGLPVILASVAVLMVGTAGIEYFLTRISMIGVLTGVVLFVLGWGHLRLLAFPLGFLVLMIPLPAIIFNQIAFPLQLVATRLGVSTLELFNIPVLREGNVIILATTTLEVAEACSGIRSLVSLITLATLYGHVIRRPLMARTLLVASAIPIAILANGVRVAGAGVTAHYYGAEVATGFLHGFSGWLLFTTSFAMVIGVARLLDWLTPRGRVDAAPPVLVYR